MVEVGPPVVTQAEIIDWYNCQQELKRLKAKESLLRAHIFRGMFTDPKEGVNRVELNDGSGAKLKAEYPITRTVGLEALMELIDLSGRGAGPKLHYDSLVKYKPELIVGGYRELTAEEQNYFDRCLTIKPGSPQLTIEPKKESK